VIFVRYATGGCLSGIDIALYIQENYTMSRKPHIIFIIAAIILIPILLGATPIKIVKKLVGECPFANSKVAMCSIPCIFNTVTSQSHTDNVGDAGLPPSPFVFYSTTLLFGETTENHVVTITNYFLETPPLRC
jgi:xanthosine utilization system XapX-like protein